MGTVLHDLTILARSRLLTTPKRGRVASAGRCNGYTQYPLPSSHSGSVEGVTSPEREGIATKKVK
jgi:hypothetical protein